MTLRVFDLDRPGAGDARMPVQVAAAEPAPEPEPQLEVVAGSAGLDYDAAMLERIRTLQIGDWIQLNLIRNSGAAFSLGNTMTWLLTLIPTDAAGRAFAAYGGVYICASLIWMAVIEKTPPDRWDVLGGLVCLVGAGIILVGPRAV